MRAAAIMLACLSLSACATAANEGGVANYDSLAQAQALCAASGGDLRLKSLGDPQDISQYECHRK